MRMEWVGRVVAHAAAHHGVISVDEANALGVDRRAMSRAANQGVLRRVHRDVFALAGPMLDQRGRARAATLQVPGSVASHESGLLLAGVDRVPGLTAITAGRADAGHSLEGVRVHRMQDLLDEHVTVVEGIVATTLERSVVDVVSVFSVPRMKDLLDRITIQRRMTSIGRIARAYRQVNRRGRVGIGRLAVLLDERSPGEPSPRSVLERLVDDLLESTPLPAALREHPLPCDGTYRGYVDRAWIEPMLIVEIDGRSWHAREAAMANDRARDRAAARQGWQTLRVLGEEVRECPDEVVDDVVAACWTRLTQLGRRSA